MRQLETNLARVRPDAGPEELRELSRAGMRSYLRYYCDAFRLPGWSRERLTSTRPDGGRRSRCASCCATAARS